MDVVITYVNESDIEWQKQYHSVSDFINIKRYRDWGTLRYVLRGISQCMPYIRNVFLVVSMPSQVPLYVNTDKVKIIYHKDIIPEKFLPTFNSNTIETYLYRIPGLSEQFVYFNDDMIPTRYMAENTFFEGGLPCYMNNPYDMTYNKQCNNIFMGVINTCNNLAKLAVGTNKFSGDTSIFFTQHTGTPFLKSDCEECYNKISNILENILTRFREKRNPSQFLYSAYSYYKGNYVAKQIPHGFVSIGDERYKLSDICEVIQSDEYSSICINDNSIEFTEEMIDKYRTAITETLETVLPIKGKYEK